MLKSLRLVNIFLITEFTITFLFSTNSALLIIIFHHKFKIMDHLQIVFYT